MTTVLFAHDGYMSKANGDIYSDTYDNKIIDRYFKIAENVVFLVRTRDYLVNDKNLNKITRDNFKVEGIKNFKSLKGIFEYRMLIEKVKREVRKSDYIVARIPSDLGFLVAKYAEKYNKRYMVEVVGCPWDSLRNHSTLGKVIAPYYYLKQKATIKKAPFALYVTNDFLQKRYPCKGRSTGCSDVEIENTNESILARRKEKIRKSNIRSLVFGTMGALHMKYKGYDTVIQALSKLNKEGHSHKYLIAGGGDPLWLNSMIKKYGAEDFVSIVPSMPHEKVFGWLDTIDVYVQPSKTEGMPRALIEAMSRGLPSIGSNAGGIPELLRNESIFKVGNFQQLLQVINKLSKQVLLEWTDNNFETAKAFNYEELINQRINFYKLFLKG